MKKYAICYNKNINYSESVVNDLTQLLIKMGQKYDILNIDELKSNYDFAFIIGGDGTILKAARFYAKYETPIYGINLGRLGFLSQTTKENLEYSIIKILNNHYIIENRIMLKADKYFALNDFVIKGNEAGRTNRFSLEINSKFVCEYLADGLIVSTPTGSTAYSMSAGGPIITPNLNVIIITPICPHTFSARPLVISASDKIKIKPCQNTEYKVYSDGQTAFDLMEDLIIEKAEYDAKLALQEENDFFEILRSKLNWAITSTKCN